jgi:protein-S-isoprenylcysteine O-methyltransferase Ste14
MFLFFLLVFAGAGSALLLTCLGLATYQRNPLGWFLIFAGIGYCFGGAIYLAIELRRKMDISKTFIAQNGDWTTWLLTPGFLGILFGSALDYLFLPEWLPRTNSMVTAGVVIVVLGFGLRLWVRKAMGSAYSGRLQVNEDQTMVVKGPYRWVRHPGYLGFFLFGVGLAIGYSSLIGLFSTLFLLLPALVYRARIEEKLLKQAYGAAYDRYLSRIWRMIPGVW